MCGRVQTRLVLEAIEHKILLGLGPDIPTADFMFRYGGVRCFETQPQRIRIRTGDLVLANVCINGFLGSS